MLYFHVFLRPPQNILITKPQNLRVENLENETMFIDNVFDIAAAYNQPTKLIACKDVDTQYVINPLKSSYQSGGLLVPLWTYIEFRNDEDRRV